MKKIMSVSAIALLFLGQLAFSDDKQTSNNVKVSAFPKFQPKNLGAPVVRVGGGTRGNPSVDLELIILAPEQVGFTTKKQPTIYWYLAKPVNKPIQIALSDKHSVLLKINLDKGADADIHSVNLFEHRVTLIPEVEYKLAISIINNPKQRSADITAIAGVMQTTPSNGLLAQLSSASLKEQVSVYAKEGIWYDAFTAIQELNQLTEDKELAATLRKNYLGQVGLKLNN